MNERVPGGPWPENQGDRYRAVVAAALEGIVITDRRGAIVEVNDAACALLGRARPALLGTDVSGFAPGVGQLVPEEDGYGAIASSRSFRVAIERPDGTAIHGEVLAQTLPNGERLALIRDASTVVELERLQLDARALAERRARAGIALSRATAAVLNCSDFIEAANIVYEACKSFVGASAGYVSLVNDLEDDTFLILDTGESQPSAEASFIAALRPLRERACETRSVVCENDILSREREVAGVAERPSASNALTAPLILRDRVVGIVSLFDKPDGFDETDCEYSAAFCEIMAAAISSIRLRTDLEAAAGMQRLLFEGARDAIIWADGDTHLILDCNHAAEELLGRRRAELLGQHQASLHPLEEQDFYVQRFADAATNRQLQPIDAAIVRADGERIDVEISSSVVEVSGRTVVQGLFRDVTQHRLAHERLDRYRRRLSELTAQRLRMDDRERRQAALELHDGVGQSLAAAKMLTQRLAEHCEGGACLDFQHVLKLIDDSIAHVRGLTNELSPPVLHELGLAAALSWLVESYLERFELHCSLLLDPDLAGLKGESSTITFRVARELLMNVTRHAGVRRATVNARLFEDMIILGVEDQGCGFDPLVMTVDERRNRFGLFSIREEVRCIGGTVEVDSSPGNGARVEVRIPLEVSMG